MLAGVTLTACSNDETDEPQTYSTDKDEIQLLFVHPGALTRATDTAFEASDQVGVYVTEANTAIQIGGNEVNNELFIYNGTSWSSSHKVYWNKGSHDIYAYYPYSETVNDVEEYAFEVQTDQSTAAGLTKSDFLWASKKRVTASGNAVAMTFAHKLTSVVVLLEKGEDYTGDISKDTEVYIHSTVAKAVIDLSTGDAAKDSYSGTSSIKALQKSATEYTAIVVPQNITSRRPLVEVISRGVSYLMESKISLKPGYRHTFIVTLDKNPEQTKIEIGGEIAGW